MDFKDQAKHAATQGELERMELLNARERKQAEAAARCAASMVDLMLDVLGDRVRSVETGPEPGIIYRVLGAKDEPLGVVQLEENAIVGRYLVDIDIKDARPMSKLLDDIAG